MCARAMAQRALAQSGLFLSAALPHAIYPPLCNRYSTGMPSATMSITLSASIL